jgi:AraC family transcriptional regulator
MQLKFGQFYGIRRAGWGNPAFQIQLLAATGAEHDVREHTHETAHFVLVLAGTYLSSAYRAAECEAPLLIYNPCGTTHRDRFSGGRGLFLVVSLSAETCHGARELLAGCTRARRLESRDSVSTAFRIVREIHGAADALVGESYAWELLGSAGASHEIGSDATRSALEAYDVIMERAVEADLDVRDVAASVDLHPVHLARVFRQRWGCAPAELIRWRRLDRAADLLRRSTHSAAEIAAATGFVDQSHLTRALRTAYGVTPAAFRRQNVAPIQAPAVALR